MKRIAALVLALGLCLSISACGGKNSLWEAAAPSQSVLELYYYDGESGWLGWISDLEEEQKILKDLSAVKAKQVENWSPASLTYPVYGISIGTEDGLGVLASWTDGHIVMRDGSVYEFDYDFDALAGAYDWDEKYTVSSVSAMPCGRYLAQDGEQWIAAHLQPAGELKQPENITMELLSNEDGVMTVALTNSGGEEWVFGEYYALEVLLDGVWYSVPPMPTNNWGFNDIAWLLAPGETREESCSLEMYGELPAGSYRLVKEGLSVEFSVQDNTAET